MGETSYMRNEDFRKLLATPSKPRTATAPTSAKTNASFTHKQQNNKKKFFQNKPKAKKDKPEFDEDAAHLKEILKGYRDRAAERRTKRTDEQEDLARLTAAYRAVPSDARGSADKAHARKQAIEESKFLGGDMEHTHLVKGLDYSLLHKVRSEISKSAPEEPGDELEKAYNEAAAAPAPVAEKKIEGHSENKMVRNINQVLFKNELPLRNELFGKRRMAYVVDFEDEEAEIPTTLLRSLIDCPRTESNANVNANNMLISKLTQVLSYLRADHKKKKKPDMPEEDVKKYQSQSIYENETEYVPDRSKESTKEREKEDRDRKKEHRSYFDDREKEKERERDDDRKDRNRDRRGTKDDRDRRRERDDRDKDRDRKDRRDRDRDTERQMRKEREDTEKQKKLEEKMEKRRKEAESGGYDECYPGGYAELGGSWDSDDEDFSKMDLGNKKSTVKRWDFETQEEYESYQSNREANPKAAFQFGLKPGDGRKTRKSVDTSKKLDKELQQINAINEKRKAGGDGGGDSKRPKY